MKTVLRVHKGDRIVFESTYPIVDAESFGRACVDAWVRMRERQLSQTANIGELMENLNRNVLDTLHGAEIRLMPA